MRNVRFFHFTTIFATLYMCTALMFFLSRNAIVIVPLHLLCIFCLFYVSYFTAKSLMIAELESGVTLKDYVIPILLIISIVGIGVFHRRVKRLDARTNLFSGAQLPS